MLYSKTACVQGNLLMLVEPSSLIEDLDDEWLENNTLFPNDPFYLNLGPVPGGDAESGMMSV